MASPDPDLRGRLPSVDRVLQAPRAQQWLERYSRTFVLDQIRSVLDELRRRPEAARDLLGNGKGEPEELVSERVEERLRRARVPRLRSVVNATGVVLHTNLGRALLADEAVEQAIDAARRPVTLEYDLERGARGDRDAIIEDHLTALTGAEAATVVNNNAAAVLLVLNTLAEGKEVIVSRGELVEIGGSFRIPEILEKSGGRLREVGTTNRTHLADYRAAIGPDTAVLLKVHTSNYRVVGFTASVSLDDLARLGRAHGVSVVEDLGSGALMDLTRYGLPGEPVVADRVRRGADVVTFSGDKLLGGPQAGIIVGKREVLERVKKNPLKRATRSGKLELAALEATLRLYRQGPDVARSLPTLVWLTRPIDEMEAVGREAIPLLKERLGPGYEVELVGTESEVGSGALPTHCLPSCALAVSHASESPDEIAHRFRTADPPVIGRVSGGVFLLDLRGIFAATDLAARFP